MVLDKVQTLGAVLNVETGTVLIEVLYPSLSHFLRIRIGLSIEVPKQSSVMDISFRLNKQDKNLRPKREVNRQLNFSNFTLLLIPCISITESLSKTFPIKMHLLIIFKKALKRFSIFRRVSVVATTVIRERSQRVLSWKQRCYTAQFVLLFICKRCITFALLLETS